jgi:phage terminase Nu1 subunit (DNA packaging protein)
MATQAEVAKQLGISDRWLRQKIEDGAITPAKRGEFDLAIVAREYIAYLAAENARMKAEVASKWAELDAAGETTHDKAAHEARRMKALADQAEMKAALMRSELVPADEVADALNAAVQTMKARLRGLPTKLAGRLGVRDPAVAEKQMRDAIDDALAELARVNVKGEEPETAAAA